MRGISRGSLSALAGTVLLFGAAGCGGGSAHEPVPSPAVPSQSPTATAQVAGRLVGTYSLPSGPDLLVSRQRHPRGGTQLHLYLEQTGRELTTADGGTLVPFVATDTPATLHVATACAPRALIVRTATVSGGARARWTVREARYRVTNGAVTAAGTQVLAQELSARMLAQHYPDIVHGSLLVGCTQ